MEEYEQLIASRRQIGGQSARVRVLALQAKRTEQFLEELETLIAADADVDSLRRAIAELVRRHRDADS
nr:hypothetical protein [Streptomyces sp. S3(2020)]